jgi:hypothetical protein
MRALAPEECSSPIERESGPFSAACKAPAGKSSAHNRLFRLLKPFAGTRVIFICGQMLPGGATLSMGDFSRPTATLIDFQICQDVPGVTRK